MNRNTELKSWKDEIQEFFEWYAAMLEHIQKTREHGYNIFVNDVPISIRAFMMRLETLKNISTPKVKECKKITKSLEESIKQQIKALQLEAKYFQDIQNRTLAGRFGTGAVTMAATKAGDMLKESLAQYHSIAGVE